MTAAQFHAADGVEDWRALYHLVSAHFPTGSLAEGVDRIGRVTGEAEQQYLAIDPRATGVTVSLSARDVAPARWIPAAAGNLGIAADPAAVQLANVTLDALVGADVLPFWRALLGYRQISDDYLADALRRGPGFGLQHMDAAGPQRNRMGLAAAGP